MVNLKDSVEFGVLGILLLLSVWAMAVGIGRYRYYQSLDVGAWDKRVELETALTRGLTTIATVAANAPYVGLLGTVLGIMLTFQALGSTGDMDVKNIMTGLALALKATAAGLLVAIPCVAMNNALRRRVKVILAEWDARREDGGRG